MTIEDRQYSGAISRAKRASGTGRLDVALDRISLDPARFLTLMIVLGVVALTWVALVGAFLLRPSALAPEAVSALPPLAVSLPPLAEVESNSGGQVPAELDESPKPEPVPINPRVPHEAGAEPARPAASTRVRAPEKAPLAHALEAPRRPGDESDRAGTPPHLHEPTPREAPVHGGQATITTGHRYSATVTLSFVEAFADNSRIASVLTNAGFAHVTVTGSGTIRNATGTWTGATMTHAVDPHLSNVRDLSG
jgi:hypothetical protein